MSSAVLAAATGTAPLPQYVSASFEQEGEELAWPCRIFAYNP